METQDLPIKFQKTKEFRHSSLSVDQSVSQNHTGKNKKVDGKISLPLSTFRIATLRGGDPHGARGYFEWHSRKGKPGGAESLADLPTRAFNVSHEAPPSCGD
jgi:hypothetical protein